MLNSVELRDKYRKNPKKGVKHLSRFLDNLKIPYRSGLIKHKLYIDFEFSDKKILLIRDYNPNTEKALTSRGYKVLFVRPVKPNKFADILEFISKQPVVRKIKVIKHE